MAKTSRTLAVQIAKFAAEKKAEDICVLDMQKVANFCDFFVICTGTSDRHVKAVAEGIDEGIEKQGMALRQKQGLRDGRWVVLDLGDVVAHVFNRDAREFYGLEHLWQEAESIDWQT